MSDHQLLNKRLVPRSYYWQRSYNKHWTCINRNILHSRGIASSSWKSYSSSASEEISLILEPGGSLPRSQQPPTCPYPGSHKSNPPRHPTQLLQRLILILSYHVGLPSGILSRVTSIQSTTSPHSISSKVNFNIILPCRSSKWYLSFRFSHLLALNRSRGWYLVSTNHKAPYCYCREICEYREVW